MIKTKITKHNAHPWLSNHTGIWRGNSEQQRIWRKDHDVISPSSQRSKISIGTTPRFFLVKTSVLLFSLLVANQWKQWKPKNVSNFFITLSIELRTLGIILQLYWRTSQITLELLPPLTLSSLSKDRELWLVSLRPKGCDNWFCPYMVYKDMSKLRPNGI